MSNNNSRHHGGGKSAHSHLHSSVSDGSAAGHSSSDAGNGLHSEYINEHFKPRRYLGLTNPASLPAARADQEDSHLNDVETRNVLSSADAGSTPHPRTSVDAPAKGGLRPSPGTDASLNPVRLSRTDSVQDLVRCGIFRVTSGGRDISSATLLPSRLSADRPAPGVVRELLEQADAGDKTLRDVLKNPVKKIEVVYQDQSGVAKSGAVEPDFRIKKDGTVEVLKDPDKHTGDKLTVELERAAGERGAPSAIQQNATDRLVEYLSGRFMNDAKRADGTIGKDGQILDPQGLVSDRTKAAFGGTATPEDLLPPEARDQVRRTNRWQGSGGGAHGGDGRFSPDQASDQFPRRDVKREPNEDDKLAALKDVSAGYISRGEKDPYSCVRRREGRGHCVGRYGISSDQFFDWLSGLSEEEIERLIKAGKLPKGALDLKRGKKTPEAAKFQGFLDKMKSGQGEIGKDEIKEFLPKELQERIGSDLIKKYAFESADRDSEGRPAGVNIGKTALSMVLGHTVSEEEAARPEYQSLMKSAGQAYPLALERAMDGSREIDLSDAARKIVSVAQSDVGQQLWTKHGAAVEWGNLGCAASVSHVLRDAGVANIDELSVAGLSSKLQRQGWKRASFDERQPGDVIIALGPRHGHTGVVGTHRDETFNNHSSNGRWSKDRAGYWLSGKWPTVYVLRAPGQ